MGSDSEDKRQDQPERGANWGREERRSHVRVVPTEEQPVRLMLSETGHLVQDLSLGGLAFTPEALGESGNLIPGSQARGQLMLPQAPAPLDVGLKVLMIEPWGSVRCSFDQPQPSQAKTLASYVDQRLQDILDKFM